MNLMLGKLNPTEEAIMDRALWETYAKKGYYTRFKSDQCRHTNHAGFG
jgi:hypothetical protein